MPAALTHYLFAKQNEESIPDEGAFLLGAQGPDPFFFYGLVPWRKKADPLKIRGYGENLHHGDFSAIYARMADFAHQKDGVEKAVLISYLKGLWAHYCLDRVCHPYIFYRSGFDENGELKGHYGYAHKVFEALLDAALKKKHRLPLPSTAMKLSKNKAKAISAMWKAGSPELLEKDTFYEAWRDYCSVESFLQSRTGWKRIIWKALGKENVLYAFSYPVFLKNKETLDVLNLKKAIWKNPVTGLSHSSSIPEMFEEAKKLYRKGAKAIDESKSVDGVSALLLSLEKGIDHDGCLWGKKKTYLDLTSPF